MPWLNWRDVYGSAKGERDKMLRIWCEDTESGAVEGMGWMATGVHRAEGADGVPPAGEAGLQRKARRAGPSVVASTAAKTKPLEKTMSATSASIVGGTPEGTATKSGLRNPPIKNVFIGLSCGADQCGFN